MKEENIFDNLISELRLKIPNKSKLTSTLVDILHIEREAVYRRLRAEVPFSFQEIATISRIFGISLDNIVGTQDLKTRPFQLRFMDYSSPTQEDYDLLEQLTTVLTLAREDSDSEVCIASNMLPISLYVSYPSLYRFFLFKWKYMYQAGESHFTFGDVIPPPGLEKVQKDFARECRRVKKCTVIWDYLIFQYLVNDIKYFESIMLLTRQQALEIKTDLYQIVKDIDEYALKGTFGPANRLQIYISGINFDTNYSYISTELFKLSIIKAFSLNTIASSDEINFHRLRKWINSYKNLSVLISESGERERISFIDKQYKIIDSL